MRHAGSTQTSACPRSWLWRREGAEGELQEVPDSGLHHVRTRGAAHGEFLSVCACWRLLLWLYLTVAPQVSVERGMSWEEATHAWAEQNGADDGFYVQVSAAAVNKLEATAEDQIFC